jgi:antitoxin component YwqK of YwqJK toxin-antitoxin module
MIIKYSRCTPPIFFILFFSIIFFSLFPHTAYSYTQDVIDAVHAISDPSIKATKRQIGIAFKNNQLINIMRLNDYISKDAYLKNQALFDKLNEGFSDKVADLNGVYLEKQKKEVGKDPKPGTDTDNIVSRGNSGDPITLDQAKKMRADYNKLVATWLADMGAGDSGNVDYANKTDTDFLVSRSAVDSHEAFKEISDYINSEKGTAYTRGEAANAEYKIRINEGDPPPKVPEVFSFDEARDYVKEMHDQSQHKFDDATIIHQKYLELKKKNPKKGSLLYKDMKIARGMSHLAWAQASKYITRINKINGHFAKQYGVTTKLGSSDFEVVEKGGGRDPDKGTERQAGEVAAMENQLVLKATDNFIETLLMVAKKKAGDPAIEKSILNSIVDIYTHKNFPPDYRKNILDRAIAVVGEDFGKALVKEFQGGKPVQEISPKKAKQRKQINEYLAELVKTKGGVKLAAAMVINQTKKTIDSIDNHLDWLDNKLLGELRKEPAFEKFEKAADKIKTLKRKKSALQRLKSNTAVKSIQTLNGKLNHMIQTSATGRRVTGALSAYNLVDELPAYWKAVEKGDWNALATELFRRRVPFSGAVENAVMGNRLVAGWECITTVIPPLGLPQAIGGITLQALKASEKFYWRKELTQFKEGLFETAEFRISEVKSHEGIKTGKWKLVSVTIKYTDTKGKKRVDAIKQDGLREWVEKSWYLNDILSRTIYSADPILNAIWDIWRHPAIGEKTRKNLFTIERSKQAIKSHYLQGMFQRKNMLKDWFVANLITQLEDRMAAEYSLISGNYEELFTNLTRISEQLEIKEELKNEMKLERKSTILTWLWDRHQDLLVGGGNVSGEMTELATIMSRYLDAYETVLEQRKKAEEEAGLTGKSNGGLRLLTGPNILDANLKADLFTADIWSKMPGEAKSKVKKRLLKIKRKYIKDAKLEGAFDLKIQQEALQHEVWRKAWTHVYKNRAKIKSTAEKQAKLANRQLDIATDLFEKHYKGMTTMVRIHLKQEIDGQHTALPVKGANVSLQALKAANEFTGKVVEKRVGGSYEKEVLPGTYRIIVGANGFRTPDGLDTKRITLHIPVPKDGKGLIEQTLYLSPIKGELRVRVIDTLNGNPVSHAKVKLSPVQSGYGDFQSVDKEKGRFLFQSLNPGKNYKIEAKAPYYLHPVSKDNIVLDTGGSGKPGPALIEIELMPILSTARITVLNHADGKPLSGVLVDMAGKSGKTNEHGIAELLEVRPSIDGSHELLAQLAGYAVLSMSVPVLPTEADKQIEKILRLRPGGKLSVTVMDEESGAPIPKAEIRVTGYPEYDKQKLGSQNGKAVFTHLALEEHSIQVSKEGYLSPERDITARISADNPEQNIIIKMAAGIKVKVHIRDKKTKAYVIGRVSLNGGVDKFAPSGSFEFARLTTDKAHTFNVSADCYEQATKTIIFSPSPDNQTLEFALNPALSLRVEARDGAALIKGTSQIAINGPGLSGKGQGASKLFGGLTAGSYTATIMAEGYTKGTGSITINPDDKRCSYTLLVQMKKLLANLSVSAVLSGKLEEGEPVPKVNISVSGPTSYSGIGRFAKVKGLPKGSYTITASAKGYSTASATIQIDPTIVGQSYSTVISLNKTAVVQEQPPTADEIKKLIAEGKIDEANTLLDTMEDGGEKIFANLPDDLKEKLLNPPEEEEPDVIEDDSENIEDEIKKLIAEGKTEKANELLDKMADGGEKVFAQLPPDLKDKLLNPPEEKTPGKVKQGDEATGEQIKKLIAEGKTEKANELLDKMADGGEKVFAELPEKLKDKLLSPPEKKKKRVIVNNERKQANKTIETKENKGKKPKSREKKQAKILKDKTVVNNDGIELKESILKYSDGSPRQITPYYCDKKKPVKKGGRCKRIRHGKVKFYYKNGKIELSEKYRHGVQHGLTVRYYKDGSEKRMITFNNGDIEHQISYYENGNEKQVIGYEATGDGHVWEGFYRSFFEDGVLSYSTYKGKNENERYLYESRERNGDKTRYVKGYCIGNKPTGHWTHYINGKVWKSSRKTVADCLTCSFNIAGCNNTLKDCGRARIIPQDGRAEYVEENVACPE